MLPRHSGQRTSRRGFPKSRCGNPLAIYPPQRIRQRDVEKGPWRGSRHDNLPSSPSMVSRNEVWRTEGVSILFLGVLIRGHGIHICIDRMIHTSTLRVGVRRCVVHMIRYISFVSLAKCVSTLLLQPHGLGASMHCPYRQLLV